VIEIGFWRARNSFLGALGPFLGFVVDVDSRIGRPIGEQIEGIIQPLFGAEEQVSIAVEGEADRRVSGRLGSLFPWGWRWQRSRAPRLIGETFLSVLR
jgi:hypothetical protein